VSDISTKTVGMRLGVCVQGKGKYVTSLKDGDTERRYQSGVENFSVKYAR
jgi:hypothetical protein